jgi:argininosuccinate synthase
MNQRIVLAFNGNAAACAALRWLVDTQVRLKPDTTSTDVVALIVDVGQGEDPEETRGRALACGAQRAHVVERLDAFARRAIVPVASSDASLDERALRQLAYPVIAAALVEAAASENADAVAHGSSDDELDAAIHALVPSLRVIAPAREWREQPVDTTDPRDPHLLVRVRVAPAADSDAATVIIGFESGIPVSVNGVPMELPELIEILSVIGGRYRVSEPNHTPALTLLQSAYRASSGDDAVCLRLQPGSLELVESGFGRIDSDPELVSHA